MDDTLLLLLEYVDVLEELEEVAEVMLELLVVDRDELEAVI